MSLNAKLASTPRVRNLVRRKHTNPSNLRIQPKLVLYSSHSVIPHHQHLSNKLPTSDYYVRG